MMVLILLTALLSAAYAALLIAYRYGWKRLKEFNAEDQQGQVSITVIVPARNEESGIGYILQDLMEQDYSTTRYEVIVVDDHSTDNTFALAKRVASRHPNIKVYRLDEILQDAGKSKAHKKDAIATAIGLASGELMVTTDADCRMGSDWLTQIAAFYTQNNFVMIAGPVSYFPDSTLLGRFQDLDFLSMIGIAAASIELKAYHLCNGANLAYTKEAFLQVNGFEGVDSIPSGDDMMLMHKIARRFPGKIGFLKSKAAMVRTHMEPSIGGFVNQRLRWASKSAHYTDVKSIFVPALVYLFNLSIPVNLAIGFANPLFFRIAIAQFLLKIIVDTFFQYPVARFFHKQNLLWSFVPLQLAHIFYVVTIGILGMVVPYRWKGRKVKS